MTPVALHVGDCGEVMRGMGDASVDAIVTDPPYGLSFMGKRWDYDVPSVEIWAECLRVLKPGGHLLAFAGTRTQHRMAVRIEDAGFEIRDMIAWVYGSGFPKSHDVSKAIDKAAGAERERTAPMPMRTETEIGLISRNVRCAVCGKPRSSGNPCTCQRLENVPATDAARQWQGWGTALKPALEPITVARKPLIGTVAQNVLAHGTGALNIDGCRVAATDKTPAPVGRYVGSAIGPTRLRGERNGSSDHLGRWPASLIHDGSDDVTALFPQSKGEQGDIRGTEPSHTGGEDANCYGEYKRVAAAKRGDSGSAARFFYTAKAAKSDRDDGLDHAAERASAASEFRPNHAEKAERGEGGNPYGRWKPQRNHHPTVKPVDLMQYLCRLVTPPGGIVLDPFMGSGSTGRAALMEGFRFIGIEQDPEYAEIARARIANSHGPLFKSQSHD